MTFLQVISHYWFPVFISLQIKSLDAGEKKGSEHVFSHNFKFLN